MSKSIVYRNGRKKLEEFASGQFYDNSTSGLTGDSAQEAIDELVAGGFDSALVYKGGYNAATNVPDLDVAPVGVMAGDVYVVTAAGTAFYTATLEVGDMLFALSDAPVLEASWSVLQGNANAYDDAAVTQNKAIEMLIFVGDETTDLTAATTKSETRAPVAFNLLSAKCNVGGAPTTTSIVVDINKNGTTVLTQKLHIDPTEKTSVGNGGVYAVGTVQITAGTGGECSSLTIDGVDLLSAAVPFNSSINQTATDIAANIQANTSVPDYNAVAVTDTITITAVDVGSDVNTLAPIPTWTSDLASTDVAMGEVPAYGLGLYSDYTIDPGVGVSDFAADDIITIDIDQIGAGAAGKGLKVWLMGERT